MTKSLFTAFASSSLTALCEWSFRTTKGYRETRAVTDKCQNLRSGAGILFYNDEGVENGGLIFGGHRDGQGRIVDSGVSLSFDKYGVGSQMVQLAGVSDSADRFAGLRVKDTTIGARTTTVFGLVTLTMEPRLLP
jgi:hypothetical protein